MKRLIEEETVLQLYQGTQEDSQLLLYWWMELTQSGEIDKILFPSTHPLGPFMGLFNNGKIKLIYVPDDEGKIQLAAWGEAIANGVIFLSLWTRSSFRGKHGLQAVLDLYHEIFNHFTVVFGITKQENLLKVHKRLGYTVIGEPIPGLWGGVSPGWLVQMTKEAFLSACEGQ